VPTQQAKSLMWEPTARSVSFRHCLSTQHAWQPAVQDAVWEGEAVQGMCNIQDDSKVVHRPRLRLVQVGVGGRDVDKPARSLPRQLCDRRL